MKQTLKKIIPPHLWQKLGTYKMNLRAWAVGYDPKKCMSMFYKDVFKEKMDWDNPSNLIEKINWLQLNSDTSLWTKCADKYAVREYVKEKGLSNILNELYGVWDKAEDIDWEKLPEQFVLKTTQGCGEVILVKNKSQLNIKETTKKLNKWLKEKYGRTNGQTHYTRIKPRIIAEKLLLNRDDEEKSLVDYKIWCFDGKPECVFLVYDRIIGGQYLCSCYDLKWNDISAKVFDHDSKHYCGRKIEKPKNFEQLIEVATILSKGFPEIRVDLYSVDDNVYFGEMTFTTGFGYFNKEYYDHLGSLTKIDNQK